MQRLGLFSVALACAALTSVSAQAGETSRREAQRLQAAANLETAVEHVAWTCEGDRCTGVGPKRLDSMMKECRKVASAVGPLASFKRGGRELSAREVSTCNRLAGAAGYTMAGAAR